VEWVCIKELSLVCVSYLFDVERWTKEMSMADICVDESVFGSYTYRLALFPILLYKPFPQLSGGFPRCESVSCLKHPKRV